MTCRGGIGSGREAQEGGDICIFKTDLGFPGGSAGKESACNAGGPSSIPGSGRSAGEGTGCPLQYSWASLGAQMVKNLCAMRELWVRSLGWEDPLEEDMATHSSILAWRIPVDRGAWWAAVHGVAESRTRLSDQAQHRTHGWFILYSRSQHNTVKQLPSDRKKWKINSYSCLTDISIYPMATPAALGVILIFPANTPTQEILAVSSPDPAATYSHVAAAMASTTSRFFPPVSRPIFRVN